MNNLEAIWWETQDIDVNKNRTKEVTQGLNVDTIKNEIIKEIVEVLEEGYRKVEKELWNS